MGFRDELGIEGGVLELLPMPLDALIWIVGGYKGKTARLLAEAHPDCRLVVFDPQQHAIDNLRTMRDIAQAPIGEALIPPRARDGLARMTIYEAGLAGRTAGYLQMFETGNDACSFYRAGTRDIGEGAAIDVAEVYDEPIDLALFNCEGAEYPILERMRHIGALCEVAHLLVQFHRDIGAADDAVHATIKAMVSSAMGAEPQWDHDPAWVYWRNVRRAGR